MFKLPMLFIIAILSIAATATAEATPKKKTPALIVCNERGCSDHLPSVRAQAQTQARAQTRQAARANDIDANGNTVIVGRRPDGCPHRYCGCEASLYLFGEIRRDLNLASNWIRKFARTEPARGMVAARSGHVMVLMHHVEGKEWMVHDGNSGGGRTREHVRSIAGYVIVDPHSSRTASR
jgi:hypothetical protein